jgi:hypothetical protein
MSRWVLGLQKYDLSTLKLCMKRQNQQTFTQQWIQIWRRWGSLHIENEASHNQQEEKEYIVIELLNIARIVEESTIGYYQ